MTFNDLLRGGGRFQAGLAFGGGKGGSETTEIELPPHITKASIENLEIADEVASIGYMPWEGPTVAALSPQQQAAMQNTGSAAQAFGMSAPGSSAGKGGGANEAMLAAGIDPYTGLPQAQTYAGGIQGYSPFDLYEQQVGNIPPAQRAFVESFVVDPNTGQPPVNPAVPGQQFRYEGPNSWWDSPEQQAIMAQEQAAAAARAQAAAQAQWLAQQQANQYSGSGEGGQGMGSPGGGFGGAGDATGADS
jgi:hypothetical protein